MKLENIRLRAELDAQISINERYKEEVKALLQGLVGVTR